MRFGTFLSVFSPLLLATILNGQISNAAEIAESGKIDVWDFGAEQLDTATYQNHLTLEVIKSFNTDGAINFPVDHGLWMVKINACDGQKAVKVIAN